MKRDYQASNFSQHLIVIIIFGNDKILWNWAVQIGNKIRENSKFFHSMPEFSFASKLHGIS